MEWVLIVLQAILNIPVLSAFQELRSCFWFMMFLVSRLDWAWILLALDHIHRLLVTGAWNPELFQPSSDAFVLLVRTHYGFTVCIVFCREWVLLVLVCRSIPCLFADGDWILLLFQSMWYISFWHDLDWILPHSIDSTIAHWFRYFRNFTDFAAVAQCS